MIMLGATPSETQYGPEPPLTEGLSERLKLWDLDPADFEIAHLKHEKHFRNKCEDRTGRGHTHYENLRDEQLTDAHMYNIFPIAPYIWR